MSHSLNEIEAIAKKAARGAGYAWGLAEEAGKAVRWLESHGLPGAAALVGHLNVGPVDGPPQSLQGDWTSDTGVLCPLTSGAALNDCADQLAGGGTQRLIHVNQPLLIASFAAWAALYIKAPVQVRWQNVRIETDGTRACIDDPDREIDLSHATVLVCQMTGLRVDTAVTPHFRGNVAPEVWQTLDAFAKRTYAPATEASRQFGAGAGVTDND